MSISYQGAKFTAPPAGDAPRSQNIPDARLYDIQTSYLGDLFKDSGLREANNLDAGFGSLAMRDVASEIVIYRPFDFVADTLMQVFGNFRTTDRPGVEWYETDLFHPLDAVGNAAAGAGATIINGSTPFTPAQTGIYKLAAGSGNIFRVDDKVRYETSSGWHIARVSAISTDDLTLMAIDDTTNLPAGVVNAGKIEVLGSIRNLEKNLNSRPRGSFGEMKYTYIERIAHETNWTNWAVQQQNYVNTYEEAQDKLSNMFRFNRSSNVLYGTKGKKEVTLDNGATDWAYASPGIWDLVNSYSRMEATMTTSGNFDATKFKKVISEAVRYLFGAESGGPKVRPALVTGKFASYMSEAYEDKQRFFGQEYIAGIHCMRFEDNLGMLDFIHEPFMEMRSPTPDGSLKDGEGRAMALIVPFEECATRVQGLGGGPREKSFQINGGDDEWFTRVESIEGIQLGNLPYTSTIVEQI